ncbi:MAG: dTDP-4-dehydrorhamnose reductase [Bacteroidetes bacterium]|nr:dTDP-4-dehydrorhamnose reductase [Bacteroidota bacterium]
MKRILVCGSNGLLGQKLAWMLKNNQEYEVLHTSYHRSFFLGNYPFDYTQLDISKRSDVKSLVTSYRPDIILNPAGMTNVDQCEVEREAAWKTNVIGLENLAESARRIGAKLIHISTDYVFDGKNGPYKESDRTNPVNYYGKTKLAGENVIIGSRVRNAILRTILIYGTGIQVKNNFALWVVKSLRENKPIRCFEDQIASPTFLGDIALAVLKVIEVDAEGLYHISGEEAVSRYNFAVQIAKVFNLDSSLIEKRSLSNMQLPAQRPPVTGFILEKAKNELRFQPTTLQQGLVNLKQELGTITLN